MSEQLAIEEVGVPTPPGVKIFPGQRFALEQIAEHAPLSSERLGAFLHERRKANGGHGHPAGETCPFCKGEGAHMGGRLRELGLVRYSRKREGWYTEHFGLPPPASPSPAHDNIPF